jgi:tetratricopeptide (TPR) repeat protein
MRKRDQDAIALFRKGMKAVDKDLPAQTVEYLGQGLRKDSCHRSFWYFYADALGQLALYEDSEKAFRKALKLSKGEMQSSIWSSFAEMLAAQGRHKAAERAHRNAIRAKPKSGYSWVRFGGFLAKLGRLDEAQVCHRKATTLREGAIDEAYLNLGYIYRAKGNYKLAKKCFLKAIQLDPDYSHAKAGLKDVAPLA